LVLVINNLSGLFEKEIGVAVTLAIQHLPEITNRNLREGIQDRLENTGIIKIRSTRTQDNSLYFFNECYTELTRQAYCHTRKIPLFVRLEEITICISNISKARLMGELWQYIIHEFAHTCGWEHGQGMGIPENNGFILPR